MTSLTDAKKRLYVINNGFNYHLIVLSTSPLLFLFIFFYFNISNKLLLW